MYKKNHYFTLNVLTQCANSGNVTNIINSCLILEYSILILLIKYLEVFFNTAKIILVMCSDVHKKERNESCYLMVNDSLRLFSACCFVICFQAAGISAGFALNSLAKSLLYFTIINFQ